MVSITEVPSTTPVTATATAAETTDKATNGSSSATAAAATSTATSSAKENVVTFYENPDQLKKLCDFLCSRNGPPVREALLMDKRVHYLKGMLFIYGVCNFYLYMHMLHIFNLVANCISVLHVFQTSRHKSIFKSYQHALNNRIYIFCLIYKGEKLVNFLVEPKKGTKWPTKLLRFQNRHDAIAICKELCKNQYLLRSEKCGKGELEVRIIFYSLAFSPLL
jgi:hypothetical protein